MTFQTSLLAGIGRLLFWHPSRRECFFDCFRPDRLQKRAASFACEAFASKAQTGSVVGRIQRFFEKQVFDFALLAQGILEVLSLPEKVDLVIDRTNWKFGKTAINFLVLSVTVTHKHGIPLLWKALPKEGASGVKEQSDLLRRFIRLFGAGRVRSLTAGSLWGPNGLPFLPPVKFLFTFASRKIAWLTGEGMKRNRCELFQAPFAGMQTLLYKEIAGVEMAIAGTRSKNGDLVFVMTNQVSRSSSKILSIYRRRWAIETLFCNTKSSGFNFEDTHVKSHERLEKLMGAIAVATALCLRTGQKQEALRPTPYRKTLKACLYSLFRRGFDFLLRLLSHKSRIRAILRDLSHPLKKSVG